jgi:hypothetical protein
MTACATGAIDDRLSWLKGQPLDHLIRHDADVRVLAFGSGFAAGLQSRLHAFFYLWWIVMTNRQQVRSESFWIFIETDTD